MNFAILFDLVIQHAFYTDERCLDVAIGPTQPTARRLAGHRAQIQPRPHGIRVIVELTKAGKPLIPFATGETLDFALKVLNPDFARFTSLTELEALEAPLYTNVHLGPTEKELQLINGKAWGDEAFAVRYPGARELFILNGKPRRDATAADFTIEHSEPLLQVASYHSGANTVEVDTRSARSGDRFRVRYPLPAGYPPGVLAKIRIAIDEAASRSVSAPGTPPPEFPIVLQAREYRWAYYCITSPQRVATDLRIEAKRVNGIPLDVAFSDSNRTDLNQAPDPDDPVAADLSTRFPDRRIVRFVSDAAVPCRQAPRTGLALKIKESTLFGSLPNPAFQNYCTLKTARGESTSKQDVLFHLVEFLSH